MREIVRSVADNNTQYAAIDWDSADLFSYDIFYIESADHEADPLPFHEHVEALYKKWMMGEEMEFTIPVKQYHWNCREVLVPTCMLQKEKNEYLAKKAQKKIQAQFNKIYAEKIAAEIAAIHNKIHEKSSMDELQQLSAEAKTINEQIRNAVAAAKNSSLQQGVVQESLAAEDFLMLKSQLDNLFDKYKQVKENAHFSTYNILGARVEAAYAQSKSSENFNDTRKDIIALQKELFEAELIRWQKDELIARLRKAFDHINERQDQWRAAQNQLRAAQAQALQVKYDERIPRALALNFSEGFAMLKELQEITNVTNLSKESRDGFYTRLDEAFTTIKAKADEENDANFKLAGKAVDVAIISCNAAELFKDGRAILTAAQNELKEMRLGRKQKDELFAKLRAAFEELNKKQDEYFARRKEENNEHLQGLLQTLRRALVRKEEGMERLYQNRQNIEAKTGMFKNTKSGTNELLNQFLQRLTDVDKKIASALKDINQLKKKIEKIEKEIGEK